MSLETAPRVSPVLSATALGDVFPSPEYISLRMTHSATVTSHAASLLANECETAFDTILRWYPKCDSRGLATGFAAFAIASFPSHYSLLGNYCKGD